MLLVLLAASVAVTLQALTTYQRAQEATVLDRRFDETQRDLRDLRPPRAGPCAAGGRTSVPARIPPVVAGRLNPDYAQQCLAPAFGGQQVMALVLSPGGAALGCSDTSAVETNTCQVGATDYPALALADYLAAARGQQRRYYLVGGRPAQSLVVVRPLRARAGGPVLALVQLSESTETLQRTRDSVLLVLLLATALLICLAAALTPLLVGRALRPLHRVTDASVAIAAGELDRRVDEPARQDELGRLARAFNRMAAAVQSALALRAESEGRMRSFVADASHELRTPLTTIQGQLDLLRRGAADDPDVRRSSLESMQRETKRMSTMVEDLLTLTRLDSTAAGAAELVRDHVNIDSLVADLVEDQSVRAPDQLVEVETEAGAGGVVIGDPEQLRRALLNISTNALKYAPGGTHRWRTEAHDGRVVVEFSDQGPGIPEADLPRIFDRFYRASGDSSSSGTGLGLSIVRSVVESHGGTVTASNREDGGATFRIELPQAAG